MRTRILAALLAFGTLTACESDETKLERLKREESLARLSVLHMRNERDRIGGPWVDSLRVAENHYELAQRNLRKFLDGR